MTILKNLFQAVVALVSMLIAAVMLGPALALICGLGIAVVAATLNAAEHRAHGSDEDDDSPRRYGLLGAALAVTIVWAAIMMLAHVRLEEFATVRFGLMALTTIGAVAFLLSDPMTPEGERDMTTMKTVFATLLGLATMLVTLALLGPWLAFGYALVIGVVGAIVTLTNARPAERREHTSHNAGRAVLATLWTVIVALIAIGGRGEFSGASPMLGGIFISAMVATAVLLNVSLASAGEGRRS
jgi:hypothetical protein